MPDLTGNTLLNRYRIDTLLGRGGMAEVYKAWDRKRSIYVALKVLHQDLAEDMVFVQRFAREARALELLQHPSIMRFWDFEETTELAFLVMEYIDGITLRSYLKQLGRPLTIPETLGILQPICLALHYAHNEGVYHCDIKPANIFIERGGRVVLGDFGIARLSESATMTFSTPGTPAYMSPEQCQGEALDARTDIYSMGITAYEMLTLDRPFKGDSTTTGSRGERVRWEQIHVTPASPRSVNPHLSAQAEKAILRALAKSPEQRQGSMLEFYQEMSTGVAVEPVKLLPLGTAHLPVEQGRNRVQRSWGMSVVIGGILFVILGIALLIFSGIGRIQSGADKTITPVTETIIDNPVIIPSTENPVPILTPLPTSVIANTPTATKTMPPTSTYTPTPRVPTATPEPTSRPATTNSGNGVLRLTYVYGNVGNTNIYVADVNGKNPICVACRPCDEAEPAWSPDGNYIIYQSDCAGSYDLWYVSSSGGDAIQLTRTSGVDEREPDWHIDGDRIVYRANYNNSERNADGEIHIINRDGSGDYSLRVRGRSPVWSPDGQKIVFMSERSGSWEIYVYDLQSGSTKQLTRCSTDCRWPAWSPDGRYVVYHTTIKAGNATADTIWKVPASGGSATQIVNGSHAGRPSWSSNGLILFNSDRGIEIVSESGRNRNTLINSDQNWAPIWSK